MADFGEPDSTQDYDHDFERVDADVDNNRPFGNENPEEDNYNPDSSDQPESSQFTPNQEPPSPVATADLLSFGGAEDAQNIPDSSSGDDPAPPVAQSDLLAGFDPVQSEAEKDEPQKIEEVSTEEEKPADAGEQVAVPSIGDLLGLHKLDPRVVELIYWRDVKKSTIVFVGGLFLLFALSTFSIISVIAYFFLALLTVTIGFRVYKTVMAAVQKTDEGNPFKAYMECDLTLEQSQVDQHTQKCVTSFNEHVANLRHYLLVEDLVDSIKFAVFLWLLTYLGAWFNGLTLVMIGYIKLFSLPFVYEKYQREIDEVYGKVHKQVETNLNLVKEKVPWLKKKEE